MQSGLDINTSWTAQPLRPLLLAIPMAYLLRQPILLLLVPRPVREGRIQRKGANPGNSQENGVRVGSLPRQSQTWMYRATSIRQQRTGQEQATPRELNVALHTSSV